MTDRIWQQRFTGEGGAPDRLDAILFERFDDLRTARVAEDARIVRYVDGLDEDRLAGVIRYRRVSSPEEFEQPLAPRWPTGSITRPITGQVHAVSTGLTGAAPELDLSFYQRLAGKSAG